MQVVRSAELGKPTKVPDLQDNIASQVPVQVMLDGVWNYP